MLIFSGCPRVTSRYVTSQLTFKNFEEFRENFLKEDTFLVTETKDELPLIIPAEFAGVGVRRCAVNVLRVHFLMLDLDRGSLDELEPGLVKAQKHSHIIYTTFSHDPLKQHKLRVLIELSRPVDITEWQAFWIRAAHHLELLKYTDRKCSDACHMYYVPGGNPEKYIAGGRDGPPLNVDYILGLPLPPGETAPVLQHYQAVLAEADRGEINQYLRDYWDAKLIHLCNDIHNRPYPGQIYDLKSHAVFGVARGIPHIIDEDRVRKMVTAALDGRYRVHAHNPDVPADRERSIGHIEKAIEDGKATPWYPPKIDDIRTHPLTEYGLRERLLDRHQEDLSWEPSWQRWLVWNSQFWNAEAGQALVQEKMIDTVRAIPAETDAHMHDYVIAKELFEATEKDPNTSEELRGQAELRFKEVSRCIDGIVKFAAKCETKAKTAAGISLASSDPRVLVSYSQFDQNPWLVNFRNGTLDLQTGRLRPHDRKDYITKIVPFDFDANAKCPTIDKFLAECMCDRDRMVKFLWSLLGYTAVGVTSEQILILCIGDGCNGKTTFLNLMLEAFGGLKEGSYAFNSNSENLLTVKGASKHETWRMDMCGKRLVTAQEIEEGRTFAESLIKELTGSDPITGRRMHQDNWSYNATFQLWMCANHLPHIRSTDEGIWRRIVVVPWDASFKGKEDRKLAKKLQKEIPGLWARIAQEALAWIEKGLIIPREVVAASLRYRREQDPLQPFFDAWCLIDPREFCRRDLLWASYLEYAESTKERIFHQKKRFYAAVEKRFPEVKRMGIRGWKGLRLLTPKERVDRTPRAVLLRAQDAAAAAAEDDDDYSNN